MSTKYLYYPGCSMHRNARAYLDSTAAVSRQLGIHTEEIHDWNCCGATEFHSVYHLPAYSLIARNLALAAEQADGTDTVVATCSACYLNLAKADSYMRNDARLGKQVNEALAAGGLSYKPGSLKIRHFLDVIVNDIGTEMVESLVTRRLDGLKIAPYYGCMIARPDREHRWDETEHPMAMDHLLEALGAEVVPYPLKTQCCGGHMTQIDLPTAYDMIYRIVQGAKLNGADLIVTLCPMCQLNLDAYQGDVNAFFKTDFHMPILYFTQLVGLAFGFDPEALGIGREFVASKETLAKIGAIASGAASSVDGETAKPVAAAAKPKRVKREGLPMPRMPGREGDD
jgi:heterodisulfide reductase subunit B2